MKDRKTKVVLIKCLRTSGSRETNVTGIYPPLGLAYLAATVREQGFDVTIIDAEALNIGQDDLIKIIDPDVDIIGFTSTTLLWPVTRNFSATVKKIFPNALMVIGGPHVTAFPEDTIAASEFDMGVLKDGEIAFSEIVQRYAERKDLTDIPGCVVRDKGIIIINDFGSAVGDLDSIPFPALDLLPMSQYKSVMVKEPFVSMIISRGCPYRCDFCTQIYSGDGFRVRSAENVVDEIERAVTEYEAKELVLFDETFGVKRDIALHICLLMNERGIKVRWTARTRINILDRELLTAMRSAGCYALHLGIESGTDRILKEMNKGITVEEVRNGVALARSLGYRIHGYFMIGYPGETRDEIAATLRFSRKLKLDWASYTVAVPHPRTPLCDKAVERGIIKEDFWREYTYGKDVGNLPFFTSDECSTDFLNSVRRTAYLRFYMRPGIIWGNLVFFIKTGGWKRAFRAACLWAKEGLS